MDAGARSTRKVSQRVWNSCWFATGPPSGSRLPARDDQIANRNLHPLAVLVERSGLPLDQPLPGTRLRRPHLHHLDLEMQLVARPHRPRPAELVEARADDAA